MHLKKFAKSWAISFMLIVIVTGVLVRTVHAGCYECPDGTMVESPKDCPDPAFLGVDFKPNESLPVRRVKESKANNQIDFEMLSVSEMSVWKGLEQKLGREPEAAYPAAMEIWSGNYSDSLQRIVALQAKSLVRSTEEVENLAFMLACLEDVRAQREKCLKLGRGNGLERSLAAKKIVLIESNPKFAVE